MRAKGVHYQFFGYLTAGEAISLAIYDVACAVADKIDARRFPKAYAYHLFEHFPGRVQQPGRSHKNLVK